MIIKIITWKGNTEGEPRDETIMTFKGAWTFEGPAPELTPRLIWFMNAIQDLSREYRRRNREASVTKPQEVRSDT